VYLEVSLDMLKQRVSNEGSRGIARPEGQSFIDVFAERTPLYQQYADITYANNDHQNIELLADKIQHHS
jgi:shikimate kinase